VAPVVLGPEGLVLEDVYRVAVGGARLDLSPAVLERVSAGRAIVERAIDGDTLIYGLNTGLGHLRDERVSREQLMAYQTRIVTTHAGGVGADLPDEDVRSMMLARIAGIARGGSGAHPGAMRMLVDMLNAGIHPVVPEVGSVGASDLMSMATISLVAIGLGQARLGAEVLPGALALERAGLSPYVLQPKDGLAMISANGASIGPGALAVLEAERIAGMADLAGALTLEAIGGNLSPFDPEAAAAKAIPGQIAAAAHVRDLLAGSRLQHPDTVRSVQDPLSFRVIPQVHGALRECLVTTRQAVQVELNAVDDNPMVSLRSGRLISNGNFHPMVMALQFDALRVVLAHVAMLSERRMNKTGNLKFGSPDLFLGGVGVPHEVSGLLTYAAATITSELKHLAAPATLHCPPLDYDIEDHATLAPLTVQITRRALRHLETVLVIEMLQAADVLRAMQPCPRLGAGTSAAYDAIGTVLEAASRETSSAEIVEATRRVLTAMR
jgi:histidine ammonia-lyase